MCRSYRKVDGVKNGGNSVHGSTKTFYMVSITEHVRIDEHGVVRKPVTYRRWLSSSELEDYQRSGMRLIVNS
jgi:hypothetical protein